MYVPAQNNCDGSGDLLILLAHSLSEEAFSCEGLMLIHKPTQKLLLIVRQILMPEALSKFTYF